MKKVSVILVFLIVFMFILGACVPTTFSPPVQIHMNPGDSAIQPVIAVDAAGRSHIAAVVADRVIYYRTRYGEKLTAFNMVMSGSGTNWKQYNPDIAVLDDGMVYVTWVEQRGGTEKFACYQQIPIVPPVGGYDVDCDPLDGTEQTAGNVWVTARGSTAYAVYDRPYSDGRTADLWYKRIAGGSVTGRVAWFIDDFETVDIFSLDLGIDESGFLHVGYHYNWTIGGPPPYAERLELRSNRSTQANGQMDQIWVISTSSSTDQDIPVSLSFYEDGTDQRVAVASTYHPVSVDRIYIDSCTAVGCIDHSSWLVQLPTSWDTFSVMHDVEILGIEEYLYLGFIGDDDSAPTGTDQVYYKFDAFSSDPPMQPSSGSDTWKNDLEMTRVDARPESSADNFPMMAWAESDSFTNYFYVFDGLATRVKVHESDFWLTFPKGEIASNGIYFSGVWLAEEESWFSTQAWTTALPMVVK